MSLTTDIWSTNNKIYLGITATQRGFEMEILCPCLFPVQGFNTYDRIAEQLNGVFARYKIAVNKKVGGVLTDNPSNISKAFREYSMVFD